MAPDETLLAREPAMPLLKSIKFPTLVALLILLAVAPAWGADGPAALEAGLAALAQGKIATALERLTTAIDSDQLTRRQAAKAYNARGQAYERKSFWGSAEHDYAEAVWLDRDNQAYRWDLEYIRRQANDGP